MARFANICIVFFLALAFSACGGSTSVSPIGPSPSPVEPPIPSIWTVAGQVVSNPSGAPVSGAAVTLAGLETIHSDGAGAFSISTQNAPLNNSRINVSASGFLDRETWLRSGPSRDNVKVDLISLAAPFSLDFYRQMVRNGYETTSLRSIFRRTSAPTFYVSTTDDKGSDLPQRDIDTIVSTIQRVVSQLTGGRFQATVQTGREKRQGGGDLISVEVTTDQTLGYCGRGTLSAITLLYGCTCDSNWKIAPALVAHEVGHTMGFWHVANPDGVMYPYLNSRAGCTSSDFTLPEQLVAGIAYSRPNGNTDPDNDPDNFQIARIGGGEGITSRCFPISSRFN